MGGAAVFKVADHVDGKTFEPALRLEDGVQVEKGLRRVLVSSVSGVHNRDCSHFRCISRTSLERVSHYNHVHIVVHHLDGVLESLALALAGVACVGEADDLGSEAVYCSLEAEPCPG